MAADNDLTALLLQYVEARERGATLTPEQLADDPTLREALRRRIAAFDQVSSVFEVDAPAPTLAVRTEAAPSIPGYEVLGLLGRGGMGIVYQARQLALNRLVAVKMLPAGDPDDAGERIRFRREAEAAARLQHPNIVQVHEVGEADGRPYFTLEFCAGGSLAGRLNGTPLPPTEAAALVETLARAVEHAHQAGVVHRDLKPANVLLRNKSEIRNSKFETNSNPEIRKKPETPDPKPGGGGPGLGLRFGIGDSGLIVSNFEFRISDFEPKIADFGLAKRLDEDGQTRRDAILGTPSYMAPEQAGRKGAPVGPAADVYALGAILYECLTGRPPFRAATPLETVLQLLHEEPVPPSRLQPRTPRDLEAICLKCLEKDPGRRYASAAALADDCAAFRAGRPTRARPLGRPARASRWCRRNPAVATLTAAVALLLVALTAASLAFAWHARRQAVLLAEEKNRAEAHLRLARRQAYLSDMQLAQAAWHDGLTRQLLTLLDRQRPEHTGGEDLRGFEYYYWYRLCHADLATFPGETEVRCAALSPDGRWVVAGGADGSVRLWDTGPLRQHRTLRGHAGPVLGVAVDREGRRLASAGADRTVKVWDLRSGDEVRTLTGHQKAVSCVAFSPDGRLAAGGWDHTIRVWDPATGAELATLTGHKQAVLALAFSPDGAHLASGSGVPTYLWEPGEVRVWNLASAEPPRVLGGLPAAVVSVAYGADGRQLLVASANQVLAWDTGRFGAPRVLRGHNDRVLAVACAPSAGLAATAGEDASVRLWEPATGQVISILRGHTEPVNAVAFTPDGVRVASGGSDRTVKLWDVARRPEGRVLRGHPPGARVYAVAFSPDGRLLASGSNDMTARLWEARDGRVTTTLTGHRHTVYRLAFSPDGARLATASDDATVRLWDVATGRELQAWHGHTSEARGLAFAPDGSWLASGGWDRTVKIWDVATGEERGRLAVPDPVFCLAVSPDGRRLLTGHNPAVRLWDVATGAAAGTLAGHGSTVTALVFSPDGTRLASASWDRTLKVWDAATGRELATLRGHTNAVLGAAWSPDGTRLASAADDHTVKVWDVDSGQAVLTLAGHEHNVTSVAFHPGGRCLASGSLDGTVRLWEADPPAGD
jgi:WD40 repeat protein/serine/threonine protein kinase